MDSYKKMTREQVAELLKNLPRKQDTTPLTEKKVHEITKPWNKEKEKETKDAL